jgi:hypothetical protein
VTVGPSLSVVSMASPKCSSFRVEACHVSIGRMVANACPAIKFSVTGAREACGTELLEDLLSHATCGNVAHPLLF